MTNVIRGVVRTCLQPFRRGIISMRTTASQKGGMESEAAVKTMDTKTVLGMVNDGKKGKIVLKTGSGRLYFDFNHNGRRIEKSTGYDATHANIIKARAELDEIMESVAKGTFSFAARFPAASPAEKAYHVQFETRQPATLQPHQLLFRDYVNGTEANKFKDGWLTARLPLIVSENVRFEYRRDINYWLLPLFGDKTFAELTGDELHAALKKLVKADGTSLSGKRIRNILVPFKRIWRSARNKYGWHNLPDPIQYLADEKYIPKVGKKPVQVFRMHEWIAVYAELNPYHRRIVRVMLMTGMINSEIAGLRKQDVKLGDPAAGEAGCIHVRYKRNLRGEEGESLKNDYRVRDIPITKNLHSLLVACMNDSPDDFVFTQQDGRPFDYEPLRYAWHRAFTKSGVKYRRLYSLRHTFAAWSMTIGLDINKLEALMGHGSKEMLFTRYGKYVQGLEKDKAAIIRFFGKDFMG